MLELYSVGDEKVHEECRAVVARAIGEQSASLEERIMAIRQLPECPPDVALKAIEQLSRTVLPSQPGFADVVLSYAAIAPTQAEDYCLAS